MSAEGQAGPSRECHEAPPPSEPSTAAGPSKKSQSNSGHTINQYKRGKIMNHLKHEGCDARSCSTLIRKQKVNADEVAKFVDKKAQQAQEHVQEECDSICYKNINSWLEYYKEKNFHNEANYESALIMIAIADMEHHPDPKETGGVDFQKIYRFLGDVMLGNPTPDLNPESKEFLGQEFENLINMANTTQGDEDTQNLHSGIALKTKQIIPILSSVEKKRRKEYGSLDPMGIDKLISSAKRGGPKPT